MANRFPLIVDTDDGNKLKEIPEGDLLNLANSGIANLASLSVIGALNSATLTTTGNSTLAAVSVTGNAEITGTLDVTGTSTLTTLNVTNLNVSGASVGAQVQSDWNETNNTLPSFILNKPDLSAILIDELNDIGDVFVSGATAGQVLTYDGVSWQSQDPTGGLDYGDFAVIQNTASGTGSLLYNDATGVFTYTPPQLPTNVSDLVNDSNFVSLAQVDAAGYVTTGDVLNAGRITRTVASGQVTLGFDDTGLLTAETDTLETVVTRGEIGGSGFAETSLGIRADYFEQNPTSTATNTLKDVSIETLDILTSITNTGGAANITAGGTIQGQTVTGATLSATTEANLNLINVTTGVIQNTSGDIQFETGAGGAVRIEDGLLRIQASAIGGPVSPTIGDVYFDGVAMYYYVQDDNGGSPGWVTMPSAFSSIGLALPVFDGTNPPNARVGHLFFDENVNQVKVYNGSAWVVVGP